MTYRITHVQGNGYRCSCCRHEETDTIDVETVEEVIEFISKHEAINRAIEHRIYPWNRDDNDFRIVEINEVGPDISGNFYPDEKKVEEHLQKWREEYEEKEEKQRKAQEERERKEYKRLKHKFGGTKDESQC